MFAWCLELQGFRHPGAVELWGLGGLGIRVSADPALQVGSKRSYEEGNMSTS